MSLLSKNYVTAEQNCENADPYALPETHYGRMPVREKTYSQKEILCALRQNQNFYFPKGKMERDKVNGQTRAIALFCEAIRLTAIHIALLQNAMHDSPPGTPWEKSWGTLANNWDRITNGQFPIPVLNAAVCEYMMSLPADATTRKNFRDTMNSYLANPCHLD